MRYQPSGIIGINCQSSNILQHFMTILSTICIYISWDISTWMGHRLGEDSKKWQIKFFRFKEWRDRLICTLDCKMSFEIWWTLTFCFGVQATQHFTNPPHTPPIMPFFTSYYSSPPPPKKQWRHWCKKRREANFLFTL